MRKILWKFFKEFFAKELTDIYDKGYYTGFEFVLNNHTHAALMSEHWKINPA